MSFWAFSSNCFNNSFKQYFLTLKSCFEWLAEITDGIAFYLAKDVSNKYYEELGLNLENLGLIIVI